MKQDERKEKYSGMASKKEDHRHHASAQTAAASEGETLAAAWRVLREGEKITWMVSWPPPYLIQQRYWSIWYDMIWYDADDDDICVKNHDDVVHLHPLSLCHLQMKIRQCFLTQISICFQSRPPCFHSLFLASLLSPSSPMELGYVFLLLFFFFFPINNLTSMTIKSSIMSDQVFVCDNYHEGWLQYPKTGMEIQWKEKKMGWKYGNIPVEKLLKYQNIKQNIFLPFFFLFLYLISITFLWLLGCAILFNTFMWMFWKPVDTWIYGNLLFKMSMTVWLGTISMTLHASQVLATGKKYLSEARVVSMPP